jgi:hypothetical protein
VLFFELVHEAEIGAAWYSAFLIEKAEDAWGDIIRGILDCMEDLYGVQQVMINIAFSSDESSTNINQLNTVSINSDNHLLNHLLRAAPYQTAYPGVTQRSSYCLENLARPRVFVPVHTKLAQS